MLFKLLFSSRPLSFFNERLLKKQVYFLDFWLYFEACGILVPWLGIEPTPSALEGKLRFLFTQIQPQWNAVYLGWCFKPKATHPWKMVVRGWLVTEERGKPSGLQVSSPSCPVISVIRFTHGPWGCWVVSLLLFGHSYSSCFKLQGFTICLPLTAGVPEMRNSPLKRSPRGRATKGPMDQLSMAFWKGREGLPSSLECFVLKRHRKGIFKQN